jgi:hypothetical protein
MPRFFSIKQIEPGGTVREAIFTDILSSRHAPARISAILEFPRFPRPFRKLRGEILVLLELFPFWFSFSGDLLVLTAIVPRRSPSPACSGHLPAMRPPLFSFL